MKHAVKKVISVLMVAVGVLCLFQVSGDMVLPIAHAVDYSSYYSFRLNDDQTGYILMDFDFSREVEELEIPSSHQGLPVIEIGERAFYQHEIEMIVIPEGIKTIGKEAFMEKSNSVLFHYYHYLKRLILPKSIEFIDEDAFANTESYMVAYNGTIEDWCGIRFANASANPMVSDASFYLSADPAHGDPVNWSYYPRSSGIAPLLFKRVTTVELPEDLVALNSYVFTGFKSITGFLLNDQLQTIGSQAFVGCGMREIHMPASVSSIAYDSFYECDYLSDFTVDEANERFTSIDGILYDPTGTELQLFPCGRKVTTYEIPDYVVQIAPYALYSNYEIGKIIIPNSVISIGTDAFRSIYTYSAYSNFVLSGSVTLYCKENSYAEQYCVENKRKYAYYVDMLYDSNGGVCEKPKKVIYVDGSVGTLEMPQWDGHVFLGWYTEPNGGVRINPSDVITSTEDFTAYACWAPTASLQCGDDLSWSLEGNKLVISGSGDMYSYPDGGAPWAGLSGYITEIEIQEDVLSLSDYAFNRLHLVQTIRVDSPLCTMPEHYDGLSAPQIMGYGDASSCYMFARRFGLSFVLLGDCGTCGEGLAWTYQSTSKTLSVLYYYGDGVMEDYQSVTQYGTNIIVRTDAPWKEYRDEITDVRFDDRVTYIGDHAFYNCRRVENIQFPHALSGMGSNIVEGTKWYNDRSGSVVSVANFLYAYKVKNDDVVVIGNGLTGVARNFGTSIRSNGAGPESIQISRSVSVIQDGAFSYNPDLNQIFVDKGNPYFKAIKNILYTKNGRELVCCPGGLNLTSFTVPDTVTAIRPYAFAGCSSLTEIKIGKNVTSISLTSFEDTSLQTIIGFVGSYAQTFALENGYSFVPVSSTIQFDCSGGTVENKDSKTVFVHTGSMIGELPIPAREGYVFLGWFYESEEDETFVTESFVVNEDITLYAYWEKIRETEPYITDIQIKSAPAKTTYYVGDSLDTDGLVVQATYSDGRTQEVQTGFYCTPYKLTSSGVQEITVTLAGKTACFEVGVTKIVPVSVSITELPAVVSYHLGDHVNPKGLAVRVEMNNGDVKVIRDMSLLGFEYDFESTVGTVPVYVTYTSGGRTVRTQFEVEVTDAPLIYSQPVAADSGDSFGVPIYISGNDGLMGYVIELYYDADAFEPVAVEGGYGSGSWNTDIGYGQEGRLRVIWNNSAEYKEDGLLFTAFFDATSKADVGDYYFDITYSASDTFNESYTDVNLECVGTMVSVLHANPVPELYAVSQDAYGGDSFDLPICIRNNIGLEDLTTISVRYDESVFEYVGIDSRNDAFLLRASDNGAGTVKLVLNEIDSSEEDGALFTLHFRAAPKASGEYRFRLTANDSRWKCADSLIRVQGIYIMPIVYSQDVDFVPYSRIEVPICISNNPGLMGFSFRFYFPAEEMAFSDVRLCESWNGNLEYACRNGELQVVWTGSENMDADGEIITLEFETFDSGQNTDKNIIITYDSNDTFDEDWNAVQLDCKSISVSAEQVPLSGDINEDRSVDLKDVTVITRWLAGGWDVTINETNADVNRDGEINLKDVVLIRRFLAGGWNVVLKECSAE